MNTKEKIYKQKLDFFKLNLKDMMDIKGFNMGVVPEEIIKKQIDFFDGNVTSALCVCDYGEYVSHLKDKFGNECKVYCLPSTYCGYLMCVDALGVYETNPENFVIFNKEICPSSIDEYFEDIKKLLWMKFDIVVGNPPYGSKGKGSTPTLHLKIMNTVLRFCSGKLNFVMPSAPISKQLPETWYNMFKGAVCNKVEVLPKGTFPNTNMDKTAIYYCDRNDNESNYCKKFDVDKQIYYAIDDDGRLFIDNMSKIDELKIFKTYKISQRDKDTIIKGIEKNLKKDSFYLNVNRACGKFGAQWLSGDLQKIDILTDEEENIFIHTNLKTKNILECPNKEYAENLKSLMVNGLVLRYSLWLTQIKQDILQEQFKYVPKLDYTNIHNDKELLLACDFTEEEADRVIEYLSTFNFKQSRNDIVRNYTGTDVDTSEETDFSSMTDEELIDNYHELYNEFNNDDFDGTFREYLEKNL